MTAHIIPRGFYLGNARHHVGEEIRVRAAGGDVDAIGWNPVTERHELLVALKRGNSALFTPVRVWRIPLARPLFMWSVE